jgi:hypothetical protein
VVGDSWSFFHPSKTSSGNALRRQRLSPSQHLQIAPLLMPSRKFFLLLVEKVAMLFVIIWIVNKAFCDWNILIQE